MNHGSGGVKTIAFKCCPIAQIFRLKVIGLLEKLEGRHILLASFGVLTFGVQIFSFVGDGGESYNPDQQQRDCRAHQASHSIILTR